MIFKDEEIGPSRIQEQAGSTKAQREGAAKNRTIKLFAAKMKEGKKLSDRHGFERLLELQNVPRKSAAFRRNLSFLMVLSLFFVLRRKAS
jgi:hypothetical protein